MPETKAALINKLHNIIAAQGAVIPNNWEVICERPLSWCSIGTMRRFIQLAVEWLIRSLLPVYAISWLLALSITALIAMASGLVAASITLIGAFFLFELLLRLLLFVAYGREYRYAVFTYFLVDHPQYGSILRKNAKSKELSFRIFDIFLFPPNTGRVIDLEDNLKKRNTFTVNDLGFRGRSFDPNKKSAKLRIFCLGGSTTAGHSLNDDETYPHFLEIALRGRGFDVEVVNAGTHGWNSYKDFLRYKDEISGYGADVILLHQGWNEEFLWSSLSLGKKWRAKAGRNVREEHMLYSPPNRLLSSELFITKFLAIQAALKKFVFKRNMSFQNPRRWGVLLRREYIRAWLDNMLETARVAKEHNALVYAIDYPGLVSKDDSKHNRETYVQGSRLTPLFADYQATSKARISEALTLVSSAIPLVRADEDFSTAEGSERLPLFLDEIHLSGVGNERLANAIAARLAADPDFQARYKNSSKKSNVNMSDASTKEILDAAGKNSYRIERFVTERIESLEGKRVDTSDIPTERYTTF